MRKIATLEVYEREPFDSLQGSRYIFPKDNPTLHGILLDPETDKASIARMGTIMDVKDITPSLLAHELGHFVDNITNGVLAKWRNVPSIFIPKDVKVQVEETAWKYAEKMTDVNPITKELALESYKRGGV